MNTLSLIAEINPAPIVALTISIENIKRQFKKLNAKIMEDSPVRGSMMALSIGFKIVSIPVTRVFVCE